MYVTPIDKATWQIFQSFSYVNNFELFANIDFWPVTWLRMMHLSCIQGRNFDFRDTLLWFCQCSWGINVRGLRGPPFPHKFTSPWTCYKDMNQYWYEMCKEPSKLHIKNIIFPTNSKILVFDKHWPPPELKMNSRFFHFTNFLWTPLPAFSSSVPRLVGWTFYYSFLSFPAQPGGSCFPSVVSWLPKICFDKLQISVYC